MLQLEKRLLYNPKLQERAVELRRNMTKPEKKLWYDFLRYLHTLAPPQSPSIEGEANEESRGRKIRVYRQRIIHTYIVDFYIPKYKIVIEIDGDSHFTESWKEYDTERTKVLEWLWLQVIRFTNEEVMKNFWEVCSDIISYIK